MYTSIYISIYMIYRVIFTVVSQTESTDNQNETTEQTTTKLQGDYSYIGIQSDKTQHLLRFLFKPGVFLRHLDGDLADRAFHVPHQPHHACTAQSPGAGRLRQLNRDGQIGQKLWTRADSAFSNRIHVSYLDSNPPRVANRCRV